MGNRIYSLLERAARDNSGHTAIALGEDRLSYGDLYRASGRVATLLRENGAEPGRRVAFVFEKSADALISLFAIIRTGATYVPLDPGSPAKRISAICKDAEVKLWVGSKLPPESVQMPTIVSGCADRTSIALSSAENCSESSVSPIEPSDDLVNVLFTSGSTGRPKGVQITATSLWHFSEWGVDYFELQKSDRIANHAPYTFDLSTFDIFAAVRAAATMCPVPDRVRMFPFQVAKFIKEQHISVWYSVPSALILMQEKLAEVESLALRHVIFAGEVMPKSALQALARKLPDASYTNLYGPTETNVCTHHRVTELDLGSSEALPIGRPISETRVWICDDAGKVVADGTAGELLVAGPTVTTGYVMDPQLTQARLSAAPDGNGLAYRTGDCVSRDAQGLLRFHGRMDRMLKCRGHRIEPGEIEAVLCRHPAVDEAVVVPVSDPMLGSRIKAYVATSAATLPCEVELVALCREYLPGYMVPEVWSMTTSLPRNDRGKIDLQALIHN